MIGIFSRLLITALTFSIGVFLAPAPIPAPLPALPPVAVEINPPTAPAIPESSPPGRAPVFTGVSKNGELAAVDIDIRVSGAEEEITKRRFANLSRKPVLLDLDLSETVDGQVITLQAFPGDSREFKVEEQFETSMSVSDEGPHMDLIDWKHYTSGWKELEKVGRNKFLTLELSEKDLARFPQVTQKEIYDAIVKRAGKRWSDLAKTCKTAAEGACYVTASRISFRILAKARGKWTIIHRIDVSLPMGC